MVSMQLTDICQVNFVLQNFVLKENIFEWQKWKINKNWTFFFAQFFSFFIIKNKQIPFIKKKQILSHGKWKKINIAIPADEKCNGSLPSDLWSSTDHSWNCNYHCTILWWDWFLQIWRSSYYGFLHFVFICWIHCIWLCSQLHEKGNYIPIRTSSPRIPMGHTKA